MEITAALVKELRDKTGAGILDAKKALVEVDGDMDKAMEVLRQKGIASADKKMNRIAAEGVVDTEIITFHKVTPQRAFNLSYTGDGDPQSVDVVFDMIQDDSKVVMTIDRSEQGSYGITAILSHVKLTNRATQIKDTEIYRTLVIPDDGYTLASVTPTITIGGETPSTSPYFYEEGSDNGIIEIDGATATGDISITITAVATE